MSYSQEYEETLDDLREHIAVEEKRATKNSSFFSNLLYDFLLVILCLLASASAWFIWGSWRGILQQVFDQVRNAL